METLIRVSLPIYFALYLLVSFVLPSYRTFKRTGINPITFGQTNSAHDYIGYIMKVMILLLLLLIISYTIGQDVYQYSFPLQSLQVMGLRYLGLIFLVCSLVWIVVAQMQMDVSWRIGIDEKNPTALKTNGLFSVSRNPIFLGMIVTLVGFFLILPSALSLLLMVLNYVVIQIQVRLEEAFLRQQHANEYLQYFKKVRRFI